ncbi:hypothetical protein [Porphyromonas levii]|nr:hypothetical protein [Porphyromonas levii]
MAIKKPLPPAKASSHTDLRLVKVTQHHDRGYIYAQESGVASPAYV